MEEFITSIKKTPRKVIKLKSEFSFLNCEINIYDIAERAEKYIDKPWFDYINAEGEGLGLTKDISVAQYNEFRIYRMPYFRNL